jgi:RND family efflux transporter MFP subunit
VGWLLFLLLLGGGAAGGWYWYRRPRPVEVQIGTVTERNGGTQAQILNGNGYVVARRRATVSSKITGKVIEVNVEEGMAVTEGQILARLDDQTSRAALALAESQVEAARQQVTENEVRLAQQKLTYSRQSQLLKDGITTQQDVDNAKADADATDARIKALRQQVSVAERQVELQQTEIDNAIVRAPFSGVAISKVAQPGEMVSPVSAGGGFTRTGICTIVDMKSVEVEVDVNESYINRVHSHQDVLVVLNAYPDWKIPAHVITTVPAADRQKATVRVRIGFEKLDARILPDMGVKVSFLAEADPEAAAQQRQPVTLAPKDAIRTQGASSFVFVVQGDAVERRAVQVGGADGDRIEIRAGLRPGDRVVVAPPETMTDGTKVVSR